jgi:hypothetical protein
MRGPFISRTTGICCVILLLGLAGCAAITGYDPTSYKNATDLKAEALLLIEKAKDPPGSHAAEIESLRLKLRQAYDYDKGKGGQKGSGPNEGVDPGGPGRDRIDQIRTAMIDLVITTAGKAV